MAATLEKRWEQALQRRDEVKAGYDAFVSREAKVATAEQKAQVLALAKDFPRLWHAPSTKAKDKKRMLRLLIEDITVDRERGSKQAVLHVRWQGGACTDVTITLPPNIADRLRYPTTIVERIRSLAKTLRDDQIAAQFNDEGFKSATGKIFTASMINWVRHRHRIPAPILKRPDELTVNEVMQRFDVRRNVVYYWIEHGVLTARQLNQGRPYWIAMTPAKERELEDWVRQSSRLQKAANP